ncbi:hypothetical protein EW026_g4148 [Hermanssonia centrifuga]|uniref:PCI domain-containing protein n=1 Tax=Hermanssonia centrifuga TaxID=98765 RepID=A0A4S4KI24_9APHY|nr:hypothetical protein EW026_g4148 [Hermanssonia centrifuga]
MSTPSAEESLNEAQKCAGSDPKRAEKIYNEILEQNTDKNATQAENAVVLRHQEIALVKLGELYRDQKNAEGVAEVINKSRAFMSSTAKAKTAKLTANSIYCPPHLQAQLDLQSGILHAEDKDYTTAYSYFFETFESLSSQDDPNALGALKYMLLCKVMLNLSEDVTSLLSIKLATKYAQLRDVESMRAIARAHQNRNLADFEKALRDYQNELSSDITIRTHLSALYDTLLEQNLLRIVEPYSVVEVEYVAQQVGQGRQAVELKLSQMILDKIFHGVLDQQRGILLIFDETTADNTYGTAIETLEQVGKVVDSLYAKTVKIA